ncbi:hypothetical protein [Roseovarius arcticus]|uniref:hypothetical protein n=1 Tax=Roseovarius arcticus TaxID=2547404 RepID=UPI0014864FAF|nr:hypothetical protein [Roseovarius arcticus]
MSEMIEHSGCQLGIIKASDRSLIGSGQMEGSELERFVRDNVLSNKTLAAVYGWALWTIAWHVSIRQGG